MSATLFPGLCVVVKKARRAKECVFGLASLRFDDRIPPCALSSSPVSDLIAESAPIWGKKLKKKKKTGRVVFVLF